MSTATIETLAEDLVAAYAHEANPMGHEHGVGAEQVKAFRAKLADFALHVNPGVAIPGVTGQPTTTLERRLKAACDRVLAGAETIAKEHDLKLWYVKADQFGRTSRAQVTFSDKDHIG